MYNNLANTQFTGKSILFLPSCHSTNTVALEKVRSNENINGLIIITNEQTSGRGQRGTTWISAPGANLTLSVIYLPENLLLSNGFYLNIVSSLAIADTLAHFLPEKQFQVKWPNDVYCSGKKISGILIETTIRQQTIYSIIIGIGLNVNQHFTELSHASSMAQESSHLFDLEKVFSRLIEHIEQYYVLLMSNSLSMLFNLYTERLYWKEELKSFRDSTGIFEGKIKGITGSGQLMVEKKEDASVHCYAFKEIEFIG